MCTFALRYSKINLVKSTKSPFLNNCLSSAILNLIKKIFPSSLMQVESKMVCLKISLIFASKARVHGVEHHRHLAIPINTLLVWNNFPRTNYDNVNQFKCPSFALLSDVLATNVNLKAHLHAIFKCALLYFVFPK